MSHQGIAVSVRDGQVVVTEGRRIDITPVGELLVLDGADREVARFKLGEWLSSAVLNLPDD